MFSSNATQVSAVTQAEAVDFDGTNDELARTTDLTGNADGKTFTFSCWLWRGEIGSNQRIYYSLDLQYGLYIQPDTSNNLIIYGYNSANTQILNATVTVPFQVGFTFINILISIDMANTANRAVYINDVAATVTWTTYTNAAINFTCPTHKVGQALKGRLSNVFLDYTYRDLSNSANRRLFVTADLKPAAGQAALNPILYLPMSDPTTVGTNAGTGGNFTLTGTVARSGRGPNQYNAPYSDLNGSTQYLSRTTAPTGIADGKQLTFVCSFNPDTVSATKNLMWFATTTTDRVAFQITSSAGLNFIAQNASGTVLQVTLPSGTFVVGRNYLIAVSVDLSDTSKRWVYLNGQAQSPTWAVYVNDNINFNITTSPKYYIGQRNNTGYWDGDLGALWFNTSYIDLSVASNLAKFVSGTGIDAKPVDLGATGELPTGTSPLIYLPMYGNNAGKNYGTGGDFTVNSGPYTGARGPNEYWGNKADFNGTTGYLSRTSALSGVSDGKTFSCSFYINFDSATSAPTLLAISSTSSNYRFRIFLNAARNLCILAYNSAGTMIIDATSATVLSTATNYYIQLSGDLSNSSKYMYINGTLDSTTWATFTNDTIQLSGGYGAVGGRPDGGASLLDGRISELYFSTTYIDFSQEANRLKFRDAFGNPTDLPSAITASTVPNPAIYMRFPPTSFGTNSGTGGNFTVNGTITDGGQL